MATIDSNIALGVKPLQVENPMNQYAALSQIQSNQQTNQLNALKMQEAEQELADRNSLRGKDINDPNFINEVSKINPKLAIALQKELAANKKSGLESTELESKNFTSAMQQSRDLLDMVKTPEQYIAWHEANHRNPLIGPRLAAGGVTADQSRQHIMATLAQPGGLDRLINESKLGATKFAEQMMTYNAPTNDVKNFQYGQQNSAFVKYQMDKAKAGASQVILPAQQKAFEAELGKGQADSILKSRVAAQDAASILQTNEVGRKILNSGAITGAGADFFVGLNQALKTAGIDAGYADASANSQAYAAAMGQNTAKLIKQFGAGTGLSDNDRIYAEKIAAGKISMDETAIRNILNINDKAARNVINAHNKNVEGIKTNIPLKIEIPRGEPVRTGTVKSGPNAGKRAFEYADGTVEYQ
jgi:hypothetical protein